MLSLTLPVLLSGAFYFTNHIEPAGRLTTDVIDTRMPDSEQRLKNLRADGAACELKTSNVYRCSKFHGPEKIPQTSLDEIARQHTDQFIIFGTQTGTPELLFKGTAVVEWLVPQNINVLGQDFTQFRLREFTDGTLRKVILPDGQEFIIQGSDQVSRFAINHVGDGRWRWHQDVAYVMLNREKKSESQKAP